MWQRVLRADSERRRVQVEEVALAARARVAAVTAILDGQRRQARQVLARDADGAEAARHAQRRPELPQGATTPARAGVGAEDRAHASHALGHDLLVEVHDGRQAERVGQAVMDAELGRERL